MTVWPTTFACKGPGQRIRLTSREARISPGSYFASYERCKAKEAPRANPAQRQESGDDSRRSVEQRGPKPGDELRVEAAGAGRIVLVRDDDIVERFAGTLPDAYPERYLEDLRDEWP